MTNERLRTALLERGITPARLGAEIGVDQKPVERWVGGRLPYRRYRFAVASRLGIDEVYLWPDALPQEQAAEASQSEVVAIYPHRSDVPREAWERLFSAAEREIGVLVLQHHDDVVGRSGGKGGGGWFTRRRAGAGRADGGDHHSYRNAQGYEASS